MSFVILVVDDSQVIRSVVRRTLEMTGLDISEVHEACDGAEGLAVLRENWIDIVFADLNMPRMSGQELVREMARDDDLARVPVVIVSSVLTEAQIAALKEVGVRAFLRKPFRPEQFRDVVLGLLDSKQEVSNVG